MKGPVELFAFLALSAALHAGIALRLPAGGGGGQGTGGQDMATLQASPEALSAVIEQWQTAPDIALPTALPMPVIASEDVAHPTPDRPLHSRMQPLPTMPHIDAPANPATDPVPAPARIEAMSTPLAPTLPMPPDAAPTLAPEMQNTPRPAQPRLAAPPTRSAPMVDTTTADITVSDLAVATSRRPETRPETAVQRPAVQAPSTPAPARQAAGSGGGTVAGSNPQPAPQPSLSAGERQSRMASWGAQIQRRIERARPRVRGTGRAILRMTITRAGQLAAVGIAQSSGDAAVDQAAIQAVRRAGRFPAAPDGLTEASYGFALPVTFR